MGTNNSCKSLFIPNITSVTVCMLQNSVVRYSQSAGIRAECSAKVLGVSLDSVCDAVTNS